MVELGDSLKREGVVNPLPALNNSLEGKYLEAFGPKKELNRDNRLSLRELEALAGTGSAILLPLSLSWIAGEVEKRF